MTKRNRNGNGNSQLILTPYSFNKIIRAKTPNQKEYIDAIKRGTIILVRGPAGTGKSFVSIYEGLKYLAQGDFKKLIITRPLVECGRNMGFFPGNYHEKMYPYMRPVLDICEEFIGKPLLEHLVEKDIIDISPLALGRGRTFNDSYVLLTESQNATMPELKMWLTRIGQNCKMVIEGDTEQSDLGKAGNALATCFDKLNNIHGVELVKLCEEDILRNSLIRAILQRLI